VNRYDASDPQRNRAFSRTWDDANPYPDIRFLSEMSRRRLRQVAQKTGWGAINRRLATVSRAQEARRLRKGEAE